jgi:hypothetical protein
LSALAASEHQNRGANPYLQAKRFICSLFILSLLPCDAPAGALSTHLDPQTTRDFQAYAQTVEQGLSQHWSADKNSLEIESSPEQMKKVLKGQIVVRPSIRNSPVGIHDGLVHDWTGDVFIPNTSIDSLITMLQDFDHDAQMFPEILRSHLILKDHNHVTGYWRVERKTAMLDVVLDVYNDTLYKEVAGGRWICEAYADRIQQVEGAGTAREKLLPAGEGYGFLWRMNNYWIFEARDGGVLAECRNLSLSRTIPGAVAWMINPIVKEQPKISMTSTLQSTRKAVEALHGRG